MRKLTVSTLRRTWGAMHRNCEAIVPAIRLNGNWLADAGFKPGERIDVMIDCGSPSTGLIIRKANSQ
jgi:hypothetical protein